MKTVVEIFQFLKSKSNKYLITLIVGLVLILFVGDYNIFNHLSYDHQIWQLRSEIDAYVRQSEDKIVKLKELQSDNESLEILAREQYHMVKPNEELYLIKE